MGKAVQFTAQYTGNGFNVPVNNIGTIEDYPGKDQGGAADQPDIEYGTLKIKVKCNDSVVRVVGIPIDKLSSFVQDVPLGTPVS